MASNLGTENGITVRIMKTEEYGKVKLFLREHFRTGEPLLMSCKDNLPNIPVSTFEEFNLSLIGQNTSLIAIDESTNSIVGVVIAGAQDPSNVEKRHLESEAMEPHIIGRMLRLLSEVERKSEIYERFNIKKLLYSHITCVDTSRRGQGLGGRMASNLMQLGRDKGFPVMSAYCTSFYSARQKKNLGMECIYAQSYADYKDEEGKVIFTPPLPHTHVQVLAIRL